jgi:hypothetical protein
VGLAANSPVITIERACWADWDQQGRLVFARDGKIFAARIVDGGSIVERELADLNFSKPSPIAPPPWAKEW